MQHYEHLSTIQLLEARNQNERIVAQLSEARDTSINPLLDDQYRMFRMFLILIETELAKRLINVPIDYTETQYNVLVQIANRKPVEETVTC